MTLVAGASATLLSSCAERNAPPAKGAPHAEQSRPLVPKRAFGNTGVRVSKLCLGGGSFDGKAPDAQRVIHEALERGVDFWEIGPFGGKMYAEYFRVHPEARQRVFLSGKSRSKNPASMQEHLDKALSDTGTSCIDFFAIHTVDRPEDLTEDHRKWAEEAKKQGKIRFFGFCTHVNMDQCLRRAADLGWIDGIQTFYNYRMQTLKNLEDAIEKCHKRGIGLVAVKSMALTVLPKAELDKLPLNRAKLQSLLEPQHLSFEQAKLRAVWQNPALSSVCSLMPNLEILQTNVAAARDDRPLPAEVGKWLADYAAATGRYFCRRCSDVCEPTTADKIPICGLMQLLLMARGYEGQLDFCKAHFRLLPVAVRERIAGSDYSVAEQRCPQQMPIGQLLREAYAELNG